MGVCIKPPALAPFLHTKRCGAAIPRTKMHKRLFVSAPSRVIQALVAALAHQHQVASVVAAALAQRLAVVHLAAHACGQPPAPVVPCAPAPAHRAPPSGPGYRLLPGRLVLHAAVRRAPGLAPLPCGISIGGLALRPRPAPAPPPVRHDAPAVRAEPHHSAPSIHAARL